MQPVLLNLRNAQVQRGLNQALYVPAHGLDAVGNRLEQGGGLLRVVCAHGHAPQSLRLPDGDGERRIVIPASGLSLE